MKRFGLALSVVSLAVYLTGCSSGSGSIGGFYSNSDHHGSGWGVGGSFTSGNGHYGYGRPVVAHPCNDNWVAPQEWGNPIDVSNNGEVWHAE